MKRVLFITNYAAPYRVHFFDELGKYMDVTVLFSDPVEQVTHRSKDWFEDSQGGYHAVQLRSVKHTRNDENLCPDVISWLKKPYDAVVVSGYSSPTVILAMAYMKLHRIPFYMEVDGGLIREESSLKYRLKKTLVSLPDRWLSTGEYTTRYLTHYGAQAEKVSVYPFSSLYRADILDRIPSQQEKADIRRELGISEKKVVLSIGQFIHRKAFDILIQSAAALDSDTGIYIIGGSPTQEYLKLCQEYNVKNVHFLDFMKKEKLIHYYKAADLFVLPTREDIWGLVINEAMAFGLPIVTTDRCVAGLELVQDGENGYIVPVEDVQALAQRMKDVLRGDHSQMGAVSLEKIRNYTIENMVKSHISVFENDC